MLHPSAVRKGVTLRRLTLIAAFVLLGAVLHAQQAPPRDVLGQFWVVVNIPPPA
jgi:hypothetical protein